MERPEKWTVLGVPWALIARFKAACVLEGCTLGQGLVEAMSAWVGDKRSESDEN